MAKALPEGAGKLAVPAVQFDGGNKVSVAPLPVTGQPFRADRQLEPECQLDGGGWRVVRHSANLEHEDPGTVPGSPRAGHTAGVFGIPKDEAQLGDNGCPENSGHRAIRHGRRPAIWRSRPTDKVWLSIRLICTSIAIDYSQQNPGLAPGTQRHCRYV